MLHNQWHSEVVTIKVTASNLSIKELLQQMWMRAFGDEELKFESKVNGLKTDLTELTTLHCGFSQMLSDTHRLSRLSSLSGASLKALWTLKSTSRHIMVIIFMVIMIIKSLIGKH